MSQNQNQLVSVPFNGEILVAAIIDGKPYVPMRPICNNLGLQWESQYNRIQRNQVLKASIFMMNMQMPGDDQERGMLCLPLSMLNGWLFGVDVNRVKEGLREKLIKYQAECFDVLAQHFMPAVAQAMRPAPPPQASNSEQLNASDMQHLKRMVWAIASNFQQKESASQGVWKHLRLATNNPAPYPYTVEHIPTLGAELQRLLAISYQVRDITAAIEAEAIRRIFRRGDLASQVLTHIEAKARQALAHQLQAARTLPTWLANDIEAFTRRRPCLSMGAHYGAEQPDFFGAAV